MNVILYVSLILIAGVFLLILLPNPIDPIAIEYVKFMFAFISIAVDAVIFGCCIVKHACPD